MAQEGDTITYTFSDGTSVSEDVSGVGIATVDYCDGSGAFGSGGSGGRVENADIDVSAIDTLYIWVGGFNLSDVHSGSQGRYGGENTGVESAGGSTEIAKTNTAQQDGSDEPFLVAAGGAGTDFSFLNGSAGGGRGGSSYNGNNDGYGVAPPLGGAGGVSGNEAGGDGDGAIDDQDRGLVSGGTTIKGGGSGVETNGEVKITYKSTLSPPDPPSNLSAEVQ